MNKEYINITDSFKTIGGHDVPPDKKKEKEEEKNKKKKKNENETKIPSSEKDVDGLTYIEED